MSRFFCVTRVSVVVRRTTTLTRRVVEDSRRAPAAGAPVGESWSRPEPAGAGLRGSPGPIEAHRAFGAGRSRPAGLAGAHRGPQSPPEPADVLEDSRQAPPAARPAPPPAAPPGGLPPWDSETRANAALTIRKSGGP